MSEQENKEFSGLEELDTYRQVFYASPDFISISYLATGCYIDVNPGYERFTGYKRTEVIGRTSLELGIVPDAAERKAFAEKLLRDGTIEAYSTRLRIRSGDFRDVEISANIAEINGEKILVVVARDVTDRKRDEEELKQYRERLEQLVEQRTAELRLANAQYQETNRKLEEAHNQLLQTEKMASIGQLAAGVAHEINNPIGFVNSNLHSLDIYFSSLLEVIQAYEENEDAFAPFPERVQSIAAVKLKADLDYLREDVAGLLSESKDGMLRVKKIVQDLKDFSHVGAAEWQLADLEAGLNSTLNIVNNEIRYKATVVKQYGRVPMIECLPLELNQVFMNMLVNAAHAIEQRGQITIRTGVQDDEVVVEFSDDGAGISAENMTRIFDPFFTTKPVGKGTGLGLSVSYSIVQKHHGRIEVESSPGQGTTFRIWLPMKQEPATAT